MPENVLGVWGVLLALPIGYLFGCFTTALFVSKAYKTDIRKQGSGNLGATNTLRVLGPMAGVISLAGDLLKGLLACIIGSMLGGLVGGLVGGVGAVVGHDWPMFLKFKGGKGAATSIGVMIWMSPWLGLITLAIAAVIIIVTRYVGLATVICAGLFLCFSLACASIPQLAFFNITWIHLPFILIWLSMIFWQHRSNIKRLRAGTENKISFGKKRNS